MCAPEEPRHNARRRRGLGAGTPVAREHAHIRTHIQDILLHVRRAGGGPALGHRSCTWQFDKNSGVPQTRGIRLIHGFCPFWRNFHRAVYRARAPVQLPHYACGGRARARREAAIMSSHVMAWRMRRCGVSF
eukprot:4643212-Pyramimonas_sp.AAC.1